MTDNKKKKPTLSGQVRLPADVDREIDMEASRLGIFKYEVIANLWQAHKSSSTKDSSQQSSTQATDNNYRGSTLAGPKNAHKPLSVIESVTNERGETLQVTPGEWKWVIRFLNILRSGTIAARAIKWNVLTFGKGLDSQSDAKDTPLPKPRLSAKDLERIRREARIVEQALESEDEDGSQHKTGGTRRGGT